MVTGNRDNRKVISSSSLLFISLQGNFIYIDPRYAKLSKNICVWDIFEMKLPQLLCHRFSVTSRSPVLELQDIEEIEGPSLTFIVVSVETLCARGS